MVAKKSKKEKISIEDLELDNVILLFNRGLNLVRQKNETVQNSGLILSELLTSINLKIYFKGTPHKQTGAWKYFSFDKLSKKAKCLIKGCQTELVIHNSSTSSLYVHLSKIHQFDETEIADLKNPPKTSKISTFFKPVKFNQIDTFESHIVKLVCMSNLSINQICTDENIRSIIEEKYKRKIPTSSATIKKMIMDHAKFTREILKKEIISKCTLQTPTFIFDEWTSKGNTRYMNLIIRFSDCEFNLGVIPVKGSANSKNLLNLIDERLKLFGIERKNLLFFSADGARVNEKIGKDSKMKIQMCFLHGIHLGNFWADILLSTYMSVIGVFSAGHNYNINYILSPFLLFSVKISSV